MATARARGWLRRLRMLKDSHLHEGLASKPEERMEVMCSPDRIGVADTDFSRGMRGRRVRRVPRGVGHDRRG